MHGHEPCPPSPPNYLIFVRADVVLCYPRGTDRQRHHQLRSGGGKTAAVWSVCCAGRAPVPGVREAVLHVVLAKRKINNALKGDSEKRSSTMVWLSMFQVEKNVEIVVCMGRLGILPKRLSLANFRKSALHLVERQPPYHAHRRKLDRAATSGFRN